MMELLILTSEVFTIIPLILVITLFMGKRSIGELPVLDFLVIIALGTRSEERRVGKECRSRWSPYH